MNRSGEYVKNLSGVAEYMSFRPAPLPPDPPPEISVAVSEKLFNAVKLLARLDAASEFIPDADLFVSMYVRKEALLSSQIEGTQCTLEDILDPDRDESKNLDVEDVVNYIKAVRFALDRLQTLPLCNRLICEIHSVLMSGVRGSEKNPGELRKSQNWIGPAGSSIRNARYVPPNVDDMKEALNMLEAYMNDNNDNPLVAAALIHYQFETIHPFLDGNGRVGRLLVLLYLMERKLLKKPVLYVSYFLKLNQLEYYDRMSEVRRTGNYEQWIEFFLDAVSAGAEDATRSISDLSELHRKNEAKLSASGRVSSNLRSLFAYIERQPIIDITLTAKALGVSYNTVSSGVKRLIDLGILSDTTNARRNRIFVYTEYLEILKRGT